MINESVSILVLVSESVIFITNISVIGISVILHIGALYLYYVHTSTLTWFGPDRLGSV